MSSIKLGLCLKRIACVLVIFALESQAGGVGAERDGDILEEPKGPHGGRLFIDGDFSIELTIFENGVPPEYRVYAYDDADPISPNDLKLIIELKRLGGQIDRINFTAGEGYLRGDTVIYEPHSFEVHVNAHYENKDYSWHYENFEGRVSISDAMASAMGIETNTVGSAIMEESVKAWGRVVSTTQGHQGVSARFNGVVRKLHVDLGDEVQQGDKLLTIESNESLKNYVVTAPIGGVVDELYTHVGANTEGNLLMTIMDLSASVLELDVFQKNLSSISLGQKVYAKFSGQTQRRLGEITYIGSKINANKSFPVRVRFHDDISSFAPGVFATAEIVVDEYDVDLAVQKDALQSFRDFTVVYTKIGEEYEVRMLDLGRRSGSWVEVLGGISAGATYVTNNSYLIKADIEKSGASHDH